MPEERKLVTVLFADVTGSTSLGEDLDPEDVRALMGQYYDHAKIIIGEYGGTLEKFIGDAVMAVFGLPVAHGDDAERAVGAALALLEAVSRDSLLVAIELRIGINTGEVVATHDATRGDFLVTGDAVNTAARLQQCASPGEVLVSGRTYEATRAAFVFAESREVEVKGKREPQHVFPALRAREVRQAVRPPLVGRDEDLMMLSLLQRRTVRDSRPQLVSIVAPAGTGKTRLLEEFLAGMDPVVRVATGRCLPYGQTLTYWPLRGLLEGLLDSDIGRDVVERVLLDGGYEPDDATRLAGLVLATIGIGADTGDDAGRDRDSIFNAWGLLLETFGRGRPHIIVFEDLHWASDSLLDLVEHVMNPRTHAPLLMIATSRPELLDRRPTWGGGHQSFTSLGLTALEEGQTRELVDRLGASLAEPVRERIAERSGGNPFFAVELVRIATEHAIGDTQRAVDALPDTVHAAVLSRIDLLTRVERSALQAASVVGRVVRPATLESVVESDPADLEAALDGLLARDMLIPADDPGTFTFRHILIRDVAYGMLSRAERIRMHAGVAVWLEGFARDRLDEFVELIAYHYREAVTLARRAATPLALPVDTERVVWLLERAGELASRSGAFAEARSHVLGAIEIAPSTEHARLYEKLGDLAPFGDWSVDAHGRALEEWRRAGSREPLVGARLLRKILLTHMRWQGSVSTRPSNDEVIAMRDEARRLAEASGDEAELWQLRIADLFWPFFRREITEEETRLAEEIGPAAADFFEARADWDRVHEALDGYTVHVLMNGNFRRAVENSRRRVGLPGGSALDRGDAINMLVESLMWLGEYGEAMAVLRAAREAIRPGEPVATVSNGASSAALCACLSGEWDQLTVFGNIVWESWDEMERGTAPGFLLPGFAALYHVALAREDRAASDVAGAALDRLLSPEHRAAGRRFLDVYRTEDPEAVDSCLLTAPRVSRATILAIMAAAERGIHLSEGALAVVDWWASARQAPHVRAAATARAVTQGDPKALAAAIDVAEAHGLAPHAARVRIVLAQMTGDASHLEKARPVLERLQDRLYLRRLDEVAAALAAARR
jgi:class 3 adenylate cyclase